MNIYFERCKKSLATVWFSGAALTFTLILLQTLFGKFDGQEKRAWSWYLPTVMPTLSLIIGALVAEGRSEPSADARPVDPFLYRLAMSLSAAYCLVVLGPVMAQPFTEMTILEVLDLSSLWLGPLQGLVAASLGAFFIRREARPQPQQAGVTGEDFGSNEAALPATPRTRVRPLGLELTRFRGRPIIEAEGKVHDAEEPSAVLAGIPPADRRAGP